MMCSEFEILKTLLTVCVFCKSGTIVPTKRSLEKEEFTIYGRNGVRKGVHVESRCNFENINFKCNAGYFHGYMTFQGKKIWNDDALSQKVLVTSSQTGFGIEYLLELTIDVCVSTTTYV